MLLGIRKRQISERRYQMPPATRSEAAGCMKMRCGELSSEKNLRMCVSVSGYTWSENRNGFGEQWCQNWTDSFSLWFVYPAQETRLWIGVSQSVENQGLSGTLATLKWGLRGWPKRFTFSVVPYLFQGLLVKKSNDESLWHHYHGAWHWWPSSTLLVYQAHTITIIKLGSWVQIYTRFKLATWSLRTVSGTGNPHGNGNNNDAVINSHTFGKMEMNRCTQSI